MMRTEKRVKRTSMTSNTVLEENITRRVFLTVMEMLEVRGYDTSSKRNEIQLFSDEKRFADHILEASELSMNGIFPHTSDDRRIAVHFLPTEDKPSVTKQAIVEAKKKYAILLNSYDKPKDGKQPPEVNGLILLTRKPIRPLTYTEVIAGRNRIELFLFEDLYFNKLNHILVPEHRLLTKVQKKVFFRLMKIKESQMPGMSAYDPIAMFLGAQPGDLVLVMRYEQKNNGVGRATPYIRKVALLGTDRHPAMKKKIVYVAESVKKAGFGRELAGLTPVLPLAD